MERALERVARLFAASDATRPRVALAAAGGAAQVAGWLLGTPGASGTVLDVSYPYHRQALLEYLGPAREGAAAQTSSGGFCSTEASRALARRARERAFAMVAREEGIAAAANTPVVGLGFTGALATARDRRGEDRCFVAVCCSDGYEALHTLRFVKGGASRLEQDKLSSLLVVEALSRLVLGQDEDHPCLVQSCATPGVIEAQLEEVLSERVTDRRAVLEAVASGQAGISQLWFWPTEHAATSDLASQRVLNGVLHSAALSDTTRLVVVPGSFNPLHRGHEQLAAAARQKVQGRFPDLDVVVAFELSLSNVDKGEINVDELHSRVAQFGSIDSAPAGPWPVVATRASRFIEKAQLFPGSTFVIGYDTAIRLIDPKYYGDCRDTMARALANLLELRCDFVVAGRVESDGTFREFAHMADKIPAGLGCLFTGLTEREFRVDLSSTEIRAERARAAGR